MKKTLIEPGMYITYESSVTGNFNTSRVLKNKKNRILLSNGEEIDHIMVLKYYKDKVEHSYPYFHRFQLLGKPK